MSTLFKRRRRQQFQQLPFWKRVVEKGGNVVAFIWIFAWIIVNFIWMVIKEPSILTNEINYLRRKNENCRIDKRTE